MPVWILWLWENKKLVAIVVAAGALYFAGYETRVKLDEAAKTIELAAQAEAQKKAQGEADTKAAAWEHQLADLRAANKKLTGRLRHETENAVYHSCVVPDTGVQIYNDALSGNASGGHDGSVR